jgi:hypothetical protein
MEHIEVDSIVGQGGTFSLVLSRLARSLRAE